MEVNSYDSLSQAINGLKKRGYTNEYTLDGEQVCSIETKMCMRPEEMTIVEYHRFEGASDPSDMAVVYAVETKDGDKGIIVDAYGAYSSQRLAMFLKKVKMDEHLR